MNGTSGLLDVGDGNRMYWEARGNPDGRTVLIVHGGPGGGRSRSAHKTFDHNVFHIVSFDQRGCGDSVPSAADHSTDMTVNTTEHLLAGSLSCRSYVIVHAMAVPTSNPIM
ncbi:alpha/beta fold hydrolase [Mycobacterium sp. BMJ-28]